MIWSTQFGAVMAEVVAGEWWLGDRNVVRLLKRVQVYEDGGAEWTSLITVRWRGWTYGGADGIRALQHAPRGIFGPGDDGWRLAPDYDGWRNRMAAR